MENKTNTDNTPNMAAEMFKAYLDTKKIIYKSDTPYDIWIKTNIKSGNTKSSIDINVNFSKSEEYVSLLAGNFLVINNDEKYIDIYKLLNRLNMEFKWVKFYIDEKLGQIFAEQSAIIQYDSCGDEVYSLLILLLDTVEKTYPEIMKTVWS